MHASEIIDVMGGVENAQTQTVEHSNFAALAVACSSANDDRRCQNHLQAIRSP
jgi:hypothetical protein